MRHPGFGTATRPVCRFELPTYARPKTLAGTIASFEEAGEAWARATAELDGADETIAAAQLRDAEAYKQALEKDINAELASEHETAAREHIAALQARVQALDEIADERGDQLARAVGNVRDAWLVKLTKRRKEAEESYKAAVEQVAAALAELHESRVDEQWAIEYDTAAALASGRDSRFPDVTYQHAHGAKLKTMLPPYAINGDRWHGRHIIDPRAAVEALRELTAEQQPEPILVSPDFDSQPQWVVPEEVA